MKRFALVLCFLSSRLFAVDPNTDPLFAHDAELVCGLYLSAEATEITRNLGFYAPKDLNTVMKETDQALQRLRADIEKLEKFDLGPLQITESGPLKQFQHALPNYLSLLRYAEIQRQIVALEAKTRSRTENTQLATLKTARSKWLERTAEYAQLGEEKLIEKLASYEEWVSGWERELESAIFGLHFSGLAQRMGIADRQPVSAFQTYVDAFNRAALAPNARRVRYPLLHALECAEDEQLILNYRIETETAKKNPKELLNIKQSIDGMLKHARTQKSVLAAHIEELTRTIEYHSKAGVAAWMEATSDPDPKDGEIGSLMLIAAAERGSNHNSKLPDLEARKARSVLTLARQTHWIEELEEINATIEGYLP